VKYRQGYYPDKKKLKEELDINPEDIRAQQPGEYVIIIPMREEEKFRKMNVLDTMFRIVYRQPDRILYFPDAYAGKIIYNWAPDNFGPVYLPKAGDKIEIYPGNYWIYHRCITLYEGNTLEMKDGKVFINGEDNAFYTFKFNYYWGFVPEDHIVGKAWFTWMSYDKFSKGLKSIRWNRIFRAIH
jgi:signal peptidase I